jgi:hypothetical protein
MKNEVHEKGKRSNPLTEEKKLSNTEKLRTRARVEHIFGFTWFLAQFFVSIKRTSATIGLMNLTYDMFRIIKI